MVRTNFYISHLHADWGCGPSSCVSFPFFKGGRDVFKGMVCVTREAPLNAVIRASKHHLLSGCVTEVPKFTSSTRETLSKCTVKIQRGRTACGCYVRRNLVSFCLGDGSSRVGACAP